MTQDTTSERAKLLTAIAAAEDELPKVGEKETVYCMIHGDQLRLLVQAARAEVAAPDALPAEPRDPYQDSGGQYVGAWRCFHCQEMFYDYKKAEEHFGSSEHQQPACQIDIHAYRAMEETHRRHCEEDTDLHRALHRAHSLGQEAAKRAEEVGYARGLADAKKHPEELGLCEAAALPTGWQPVPVEPTPAMVRVWRSRAVNASFNEEAYKAMLAAAPKLDQKDNHG